MLNINRLIVYALLLEVVNSNISQTVQPIDLLQAIFQGFVQGFIEFLPTSSFAHLKVVTVALGCGDSGVTVTAIAQLGSIEVSGSLSSIA